MYISNSKLHQKMGLRERMITEVARSVEVAYNLCDLLDQYKVALEVHADINTDPHFQSHFLVQFAVADVHESTFLFAQKDDDGRQFDDFPAHL
ncbi:MAG: ribonuclease H-like YkuK family protein [Bacteroidota bacterium]